MFFRRVHALSGGSAFGFEATTRLGAHMCRSSSSILTSYRPLHMPPGGFDEQLPPTFGRHQGKGSLSHTNLRAKQRLRRLRQKRKQRLPLEALRASRDGISLAKVKRELLALGARSEQTLKGPRQPRIRVISGPATKASLTGERNGNDSADCSEAAPVEHSPIAGSAAYAHRRAATQVARGVVSEVAHDEGDDVPDAVQHAVSLRSDTPSHTDASPGTLLDHVESGSAKENVHSEAPALTGSDEPMPQLAMTPEKGVTVNGVKDRSADGLIASAVESHWQDHREADAAEDAATAAMERHYAVSPRSTVLGSDLDRLERDMLREHHQHLEKQPPLDGVYAQFGSGRRGKRMLWQPSSSFDRLDPKDFATNRASERTLGDTTNRNLSPYHMYAEAYQDAQDDALKAQWRRQQQAVEQVGRGINYTRAFGNERLVTTEAPASDDPTPRPAEENPHFPVVSESAGSLGARPDRETADELSSTRDRFIEVDARQDYKPRLKVTAPVPGAPAVSPVAERPSGDDDGTVYDAYRQRPADSRLLEVRGADYWDNPEHRLVVEERSTLRREAFMLEKLQQGAMDTSEVEYSVNKVRKETFLYFQSHPINEMIQEPYVRIRRVLPKGGAEGIYYDPFDPYEGEVDLSAPTSGPASTTATAALSAGPVEGGADDEANSALQSASTSSTLRFHMDADIPVQDARRMAQELGLDLIRIGAIHSQKSDRRIIALCMLADHREHMRDMIKFKIQKLGVQPPPTKACVEVPFTGGIHPHAIRFKAVGVAKHLLHRHTIRLNLTKFGTPREGFPVFQSILDEVKRQCLQLKAYHKAGQIQADYNEIYCYLYPSTGRSPKTTVDHPSPAEVRAVQDFRVLENEKEIYFDDLREKRSARERLAYLTKLEKGTAWAEKDEGMSLQRQRALKVMLGYLPKGNSELYAARGDVNIPAPFRSSHPTSVSSWSSPQESNLEQASRGAAALGKRAGMAISDMHDLGETPENPTQLDRFYYRVQGPALEVGEFKEALGLKDNRRKKPPLAPGFATLGMQNGGASGEPQWEATK